MAFHQRILHDITNGVSYEDTDEQRQAAWDSAMLLKELNPLMRRLCLKIRNLRRNGSDKYLLNALERKRVLSKKIADATAIFKWSLM